MAEYSSYKDLIVWNKGIELVKEIYRIVKLLPKEETFALSDQMRRAAVSIPSNIAEGQKRNTKKDFVQFLSIADGSVAELETQMTVCKEIGFASDEDLSKGFALCEEIERMLGAMIGKLKACL